MHFWLKISVDNEIVIWRPYIFSIVTSGFISTTVGARHVVTEEETRVCAHILQEPTNSYEYLWKPSLCVNYQINYTYSLEKTRFFKNRVASYMYATRFGPFSGHHPACQYKNFVKEGKALVISSFIICCIFLYKILK
jgi:hypothetical protein